MLPYEYLTLCFLYSNFQTINPGDPVASTLITILCIPCRSNQPRSPRFTIVRYSRQALAVEESASAVQGLLDRPALPLDTITRNPAYTVPLRRLNVLVTSIAGFSLPSLLPQTWMSRIIRWHRFMVLSGVHWTREQRMAPDSCALAAKRHSSWFGLGFLVLDHP
jgi:hypothetical protein